MERKIRAMKSKPCGCCIATLLLLASRLCYAQEKATLTREIFDYGVSYRQNVCERQALLDNETIALRDALTGLELNSWLFMDNRYFIFDENGAIDKDYPGLIGVLLDELAERAKFTWRNSFGNILTPALPEGKTYADLLDWSVRTYDISAIYWMKTLERMDSGATFPEGWYDGQMIMIGLQEDDKASLDLWSFLEPFTAQVWGMIIVTIFVSALVYMFLDWYDTDSDAAVLGKAPGQNIFLAAITFTGQFEYNPKTNAARIFTASLAFWSLIMMSAYTANLASFLVVQNTPSVEINTVGDAVKNNFRFCVHKTSAYDVALSAMYPGANVLRVPTERETYEGLMAGKCQIVLNSVSSWEEYRRDRSVNGDCRLARIGRSFRQAEGGFALKSDSGTLCTSLVRDVLNLHLVEMKNDQFVAGAWEEFLEKQATVNCDEDQDVDTEENEGQLTLQAMGGTFIIHYMATAFAIIFAVVLKWHKTKTIRRQQKAQMESNGAIVSAIGGHDNGIAVESSLRNSTQDWLETTIEKQNEKLAALTEQNTEMLAMIKTLMQEPNTNGV